MFLENYSLACWVNLYDFVVYCGLFFKIKIFKKIRNTIRVLNSPDLGLNGLQRLSADDKSRHYQGKSQKTELTKTMLVWFSYYFSYCHEQNTYEQIHANTSQNNTKCYNILLPMRGSRNFRQGGPGQPHKKALTTFFFFFFFFKVSEAVSLFPIETHITCDFPGGGGGPDPLSPALDPHLATYVA